MNIVRIQNATKSRERIEKKPLKSKQEISDEECEVRR